MSFHAVVAPSKRHMEKGAGKTVAFFSDDDVSELTGLKVFGFGGVIGQVHDPSKDAVVDVIELASALTKLKMIANQDGLQTPALERLVQTFEAALAERSSVYFVAD
jgi:hypothetical protein